MAWIGLSTRGWHCLFQVYNTPISALVANEEGHVSLKDDGDPISLQEGAFRGNTHPKSVKYVSRSYLAKLATIRNSVEESGARGGGGGNKALDCSWRRVQACIACASNRCRRKWLSKGNLVYANYTLWASPNAATRVSLWPISICAYMPWQHSTDIYHWSFCVTREMDMSY